LANPFSTNPLLYFTGLPNFSEISPENISPAIDHLIDEGRALVETLANSNIARRL